MHSGRRRLQDLPEMMVGRSTMVRTESPPLLDNREFIIGGGTQPNTEPSRGEGLDGSATAEERDNYPRDAYENARNHASGPPAARR